MRRVRKLCAIMVDTVGRELVINRETQIDDKGWPKHEGQPLTVAKGDKVGPGSRTPLTQHVLRSIVAAPQTLWR